MVFNSVEHTVSITVYILLAWHWFARRVQFTTVAEDQSRIVISPSIVNTNIWTKVANWKNEIKALSAPWPPKSRDPATFRKTSRTSKCQPTRRKCILNIINQYWKYSIVVGFEIFGSLRTGQSQNEFENNVTQSRFLIAQFKKCEAMILNSEKYPYRKVSHTPCLGSEPSDMDWFLR